MTHAGNPAAAGPEVLPSSEISGPPGTANASPMLHKEGRDARRRHKSLARCGPEEPAGKSLIALVRLLARQAATEIFAAAKSQDAQPAECKLRCSAVGCDK